MAEPGEVLVVPADRLQELVTRDPVLGSLILQALPSSGGRSWDRARRGHGGSSGRASGGDTRRLREFAARNRLPHRWIDLEEDPGAEALLRRPSVPRSAPAVILPATSCC
jgi:thioredoxin reductase (NADPH)